MKKHYFFKDGCHSLRVDTYVHTMCTEVHSHSVGSQKLLVGLHSNSCIQQFHILQAVAPGDVRTYSVRKKAHRHVIFATAVSGFVLGWYFLSWRSSLSLIVAVQLARVKNKYVC